MQATAEQFRVSPDLIAFPTNMSERKKRNVTAPRTDEPRGYNPSRHGSFAQWISAIASGLAIVLTMYFHFETGESRSTDEHTDMLIAEKLDPAVRNINANSDSRFSKMDQKIDDLSAKVNDALGQLKRIQATANPQARQALLSSIRSEIKAAEEGKQTLPPAKLASYRSQLKELPQSGSGYWATVATIVNYQSFLDQVVGQAPSPSEVSKPCFLLTNEGKLHSFGNSFSGTSITRCVVDLDTQTFQDLTFRDSVIRYHGGPVSLSNVRFENCRFVLDIPVSSPANPERDRLLMALLNSPGTASIEVSSTGS